LDIAEEKKNEATFKKAQAECTNARQVKEQLLAGKIRSFSLVKQLSDCLAELKKLKARLLSGRKTPSAKRKRR